MKFIVKCAMGELLLCVYGWLSVALKLGGINSIASCSVTKVSHCAGPLMVCRYKVSNQALVY